MKIFRGLLMVIACLFCSVSMADTKQQWANRMSRQGGLSHDPSGGRENVYYSSNAAFPRLQARAAWHRSPGHRANLPMLGLRVSRGPNGVYVVGR